MQVSRFRHRASRVHFISLGCPRNLVDTEVMLGVLLKAGYQVTQDLGRADHIVINTCGFLKASRQESLEAIGEAIEGRKQRARVIVTGCMVQNHQLKIKEHYPQVDYFLGSGDALSILKAIKDPEQGSCVTEARSYLESGEVPRTLSTPSHYAYLKIAEGCRKRCSYCIIPKIKGPLKSKPIEQVVKEFRALCCQGVKEVILIAQDLGDWGKEIGYRKLDGLSLLLQELLKEKGDFWIRLLYLYPDEITLPLIKLMKSDPRICPYLDMPIQHINQTLLKRMHRATSRRQIIETVQLLRREIPHISLRTSLIVGFPGETEEQFQELVDFLKEHPFDQVGIFKYSREPGSIAASLPSQISEEVKSERRDHLAKVQQRVLEKRLKKELGKRLTVVIESYHKESKHLLVGRHQGQCPDIDGCVIINDARGVKEFGCRYLVKITDVAGYDLVGRVVKKI